MPDPVPPASKPDVPSAESGRSGSSGAASTPGDPGLGTAGFLHSAHGIAVVDAGSNRILTGNQALAAMLGKSSEEIVGSEIVGLHPSPDHAGVLRALEETARIGRARYEARLVRSDGSVFPVEVDLVDAGDDRGAVRCRVATIQNITQRRRAEGRDAHQRELLKALAASTDLSESLRLCLDTALEVSGLDTGAILLADSTEGTLRPVVHRGWSDSALRSLGRIRPGSIEYEALATKEPVCALRDAPQEQSEGETTEVRRFVVAIPLVHAGPAIGCLLLSGTGHRSPPQGVLSTLEAIGAGAAQVIVRIRAVDELRASENNFRAFFETTEDMVLVATMEGRILFANSRACGRLGYSAAEMMDLTVPDLHPAELRDQASAIFGAMLRGEQQFCPLPLIRRDGRQLPAETRVWAGEWDGRRCLYGVIRDLSAEREAQHRLLESETRYRALFREAVDGILLLGPDEREMLVNPAFARMHGYERPEEMGHLALEDLETPETAALRRERIRRLQEGESLVFEVEHRRRDGTVVPLSVAASRVSIGGRWYIQAFHRDITLDRQSREALRRSEERYHSFVRLSHEAIYCTEFDQPIDVGLPVEEQIDAIYDSAYMGECNQAMAAMYGLPSPESFAGRRLVDFHGGRHHAVNRAMFRQFILAGYRNVNSETCEVTPSGERRWFQSHDTGIVENGRLLRIWGTAIDITERKSAEAALQQQEQRFRQLVETAFDWIWEIDAEGRYVYSSPKVRDLLGYTPEEILGRTPFDLMPPEEARRVSAAFSQAASRRGSIHDLEGTHLHRSGKPVLLEISGVPILGGNGELLGYRGMDRDVTDRRQLESQLREAQKLEAIGQLAGGVAHDFNNILGGILMQLGMLRLQGNPDPDTLAVVRELEGEARRAANLTRQLLMFSRRSVLDVRPIDLNEVVANLLKMLGRLIGEHIQLVFDRYAGPLPPVAADVSLLEQVLMNLVVNARDALPRGGQVAIATDVAEWGENETHRNAERRPGRFVCLSVTDNGTGMPRGVLERVFEPFFTTKEPGQGTGLGLATVHGIVAQHSGWVEVESQLGSGTTFRIFLPAVTAPAPGAGAGTARPPLPRGRESILLVEDEHHLRRAVARSLRFLGYQVHEAGNGPEALEVWKTHGDAIDLLLTDMVMPEGMSGLELAERLRQAKPGLKILVTSGYSSELIEAGNLPRPGIAFLSKPYEADTLAEAIRGRLDGAH